MKNIEIERKFLVSPDQWQPVIKPRGCYIRQGYLVSEKEKSIRVRIMDQKGFITIKGETVGLRRLEYEYEIPFEDASDLFETFATGRLSKVRYPIRYGSQLWEVDEFLDENHGLIVAEIELRDETEEFDLPSWVGKEVSDDPRFYNVNLGVHPYGSWKK